MRYPHVGSDGMGQMATRKISVTLDAAAIERARQVAGPRGLSAYVDAALEDRLDRDQRRLALMDYLDALESGDPTSEQVRRRARRRVSAIRDVVGQ